MACIHNTTTDTMTEIVFTINGEDIIDQMIEASGYYRLEDEDGNTYYDLTQDEVDWWETWAEVEAKVNEALENASEEQLEEHAQLVSDYGHDMEMLHDAECELLGIDC